MIVSAQHTAPKIAAPPIEILQERAEARALLWAAGEIENIPNAVDPLEMFAVESGLVAEIGQDSVQRILGEAFAPHRRSAPDRNAEIGPPKPAPRSTPQVTIEAIMWCIRERGLDALKEPANLERLSRCDNAAKATINKRIESLLAKGMLT